MPLKWLEHAKDIPRTCPGHGRTHEDSNGFLRIQNLTKTHQVKIRLYFCHFWSNSDFSKTPITPHVSSHVLVMLREQNGLIFDAALVAKWLHIWNVLKWRPRGRTVIISQGVSGTSTLAFICIGLASETDVIQSLLKVNNDPCYVYQGHVSGSIGLG